MKLLTNEEIRKYWNANPDKFVEEFFGIRLLPYQKLLLKKMWRC
mgnify:CR=1 FL=1